MLTHSGCRPLASQRVRLPGVDLWECAAMVHKFVDAGTLPSDTQTRRLATQVHCGCSKPAVSSKISQEPTIDEASIA